MQYRVYSSSIGDSRTGQKCQCQRKDDEREREEMTGFSTVCLKRQMDKARRRRWLLINFGKRSGKGSRFAKPSDPKTL
jgi:hypothetical protein